MDDVGTPRFARATLPARERLYEDAVMLEPNSVTYLIEQLRTARHRGVRWQHVSTYEFK